ncbi:MAG: hypothetical protein ACPIOQ_45600 [Promethearchaeia archaeon]
MYVSYFLSLCAWFANACCPAHSSSTARFFKEGLGLPVLSVDEAVFAEVQTGGTSLSLKAADRCLFQTLSVASSSPAPDHGPHPHQLRGQYNRLLAVSAL